MVQEPEKTLAVNRISASKPAVTIPTSTTSSNQGLIPHGRTAKSNLPKSGGSVTVMKSNLTSKKLLHYSDLFIFQSESGRWWNSH